MAINILDIQSQLQFGGARPSHFEVIFNNPVEAASDLKVPFMCKAASLPEGIIGKIEVPYFGRKYNIAGDRTFTDWTVTIINDEDFLVRNGIERWQSAINGHESNLAEFQSASPLLYKADGSVKQFSKTGVVLREYKFRGMFPINYSQIDLNWETTDTIEEYTVTFAIDYWEVGSSITGNSTP